jgi:hypothetical protein
LSAFAHARVLTTPKLDQASWRLFAEIVLTATGTSNPH